MYRAFSSKLLRSQDNDMPMESTFELSDTLYAYARNEPLKEVYLWLGVGLYPEFCS